MRKRKVRASHASSLKESEKISVLKYDNIIYINNKITKIGYV